MTTDKTERKQTPIATGFLDYFPDAIAAVAHVSFVANEQHNPGEPVHWDKAKSTDHADALIRHLIERGAIDSDGLRHSAKVAWRALALLQTEIEQGDRTSPLSLDDLRAHRAAEADLAEQRADAAALGYGPTDGCGIDPEDDTDPLPTPEEISQTIDEQAIAAAAAQMERLGVLDKRDDHTGGCACGKHQRVLAAQQQAEHPPVEPTPVLTNEPAPAETPKVIHVRVFAIRRQQDGDTSVPPYSTSIDGYYFTIEKEVYYVEPAKTMQEGGRTEPLIIKSSMVGYDELNDDTKEIYRRIKLPVWGFLVVEPFLRKRADEIVNGVNV